MVKVPMIVCGNRGHAGGVARCSNTAGTLRSRGLLVCAAHRLLITGQFIRPGLLSMQEHAVEIHGLDRIAPNQA